MESLPFGVSDRRQSDDIVTPGSLQRFPLICWTDEAVVQLLIPIAESMTIKTEEMLDGCLQVADTHRIFQG